MKVPSSLTSRDFDLLHHLYKHRVLTTNQICDLFFTNLTTTRHRLNRLFKLQLVDRFQPFSPKGSQPMHYVLGHAGYYVISADWNLNDKKSKTSVKWSRERALAVGRSQRLRHTVGVNNFFCKLGAEARRNPNAQLIDWIAERHVGHCTSYGANPDAEGQWQEGSRQVRFFLEYDRGTETLDRLTRKIHRYTEYRKHRFPEEDDFVLLFCFESDRREANARRVLRETGEHLNIATGSLTDGKQPHEAIWLPVKCNGPLQRLVDLGEPTSSGTPMAIDTYLDTLEP